MSVIIWVVILIAICLATFILVSLFVPSLMHPEQVSGNPSSMITPGTSSGLGSGQTTGQITTTTTTIGSTFSRERTSEFPNHTGRDGREVLGEFNAKYPDYRIEIVQESDPDAIASLDPTFQNDRIRMFVTRTGKVTRMYVG